MDTSDNFLFFFAYIWIDNNAGWSVVVYSNNINVEEREKERERAANLRRQRQASSTVLVDCVSRLC